MYDVRIFMYKWFNKVSDEITRQMFMLVCEHNFVNIRR